MAEAAFHFHAQGLPLWRWKQCIAHTHPGYCAQPSSVDDSNFNGIMSDDPAHRFTGQVIISRKGGPASLLHHNIFARYAFRIPLSPTRSLIYRHTIPNFELAPAAPPSPSRIAELLARVSQPVNRYHSFPSSVSSWDNDLSSSPSSPYDSSPSSSSPPPRATNLLLPSAAPRRPCLLPPPDPASTAFFTPRILSTAYRPFRSWYQSLRSVRNNAFDILLKQQLPQAPFLFDSCYISSSGNYNLDDITNRLPRSINRNSHRLTRIAGFITEINDLNSDDSERIRALKPFLQHSVDGPRITSLLEYAKSIYLFAIEVHLSVLSQEIANANTHLG